MFATLRRLPPSALELMVALLYKSDMTTGVATICDTYYFITGQRQMLV